VRSGWIFPRSQFLGYAMVGLGGFLVDASILTLLAVQLGMELFPARCISFTAATLTTWLLNRIFVFSACGPRIHGRLGEYGRYLAVQVLGAATNLAVFFLLVQMFPSLAGVPVLPLAAGALAALGLTYFGSRRFVFSQQSSASTLNGDR
jgi:putative flippase GtrA